MKTQPLIPWSQFVLPSQVVAVIIVSFCFFAAFPTLAAPKCIGSLTLGKQTTLPPKVLAASTAILDFDGDGLSDISSTRESKNKTIFDIRLSSNDASTSITLPRGSPVPADYDGDGKWDAAVVRKSSRGITWIIKLSSTGEQVSRRIGTSNSSVISGCRLLSSGKYSLATLDGKKLRAIELNSSTRRSISFTKLDRANPLGCGDASGDGIDELLLQIPSSDAFVNGVVSVSCVDDLVDYGNGGRGTNMSIFDGGEGAIPIVVRQRFKSGGQMLIRVNSLYDKVSYPHFYIPKSSHYSFGRFALSTGSSALGIIWQPPGSKNLTRQMFNSPKGLENVGTIANGGRLIPSQSVIANSQLPTL